MTPGATLLLFEPSTITLCRQDAARLRLKTGDGLLSCGKKTVPVRFQVGAPARSLEAPFSVLSILGLAGAESALLGFYRGPDGVPRLGPVVTALQSFPVPMLPRYETTFLRNLARYCREQGILFSVMLPEQADLAARQGRGCVAIPAEADESGALWEERPLPLPDVVFNQVALLSPVQMESYRRISQLYSARPGGHPSFLTRGWLDKSKAFQLLGADHETIQYLPRTVSLGPVETMWQMLAEFGQVFLKPEAGSHGLNIIRLSAEGPSYLGEFRSENVNVRRSFASRGEVESFLAPALSKATYVCQQAISRPKIDGGAVDFRVALARNGQGRWEVCYYRLKRAPAGAICTNWDYGSTWHDLEELMDRVFPGRERSMVEVMDRCGLDVARAVSGAEAGDPCQLAVDLVLDPGGRPWVLEVNDRPEHGHEQGEKVARALVSYFIQAAGAMDRVMVRVFPVVG